MLHFRTVVSARRKYDKVPRLALQNNKFPVRGELLEMHLGTYQPVSHHESGRILCIGSAALLASKKVPEIWSATINSHSI